MMSRFLKKTRQLVSLNLLRRILKSARSLEIFEIFFNPNFLRLKSKRLKEARKRSPRISKKKSPNCHFVSFLIILLFEKTKSLFFRCIYYVYLWNVAILKNKSIFGFKNRVQKNFLYTFISVKLNFDLKNWIYCLFVV